MSFYEWTAALAALIGAITAICKSIRKVAKPILDIGKKVDSLVLHDKEQYLAILRLTVMEEDMPISERLIAGKKYIDAGGNGDVKKYYDHLIAEHTK